MVPQPAAALSIRGNIELFHFEKRLGDALDTLLVVAAQEFLHGGWSDLPGQAVLVLERATLFGFRVCRKLLPEVIDLFLRVAGTTNEIASLNANLCSRAESMAPNSWPRNEQCAYRTIPSSSGSSPLP
jgi:hypothetical protein